MTGARELERYKDPSGKVVHAELELEGLRLTLKDTDGTDPA